MQSFNGKLQKTVKNLSLSSKLSPGEGYTKLDLFSPKKNAAALPCASETGRKTDFDPAHAKLYCLSYVDKSKAERTCLAEPSSGETKKVSPWYNVDGFPFPIPPPLCGFNLWANMHT